jgi:hypothetical protein
LKIAPDMPPMTVRRFAREAGMAIVAVAAAAIAGLLVTAAVMFVLHRQ